MSYAQPYSYDSLIAAAERQRARAWAAFKRSRKGSAAQSEAMESISDSDFVLVALKSLRGDYDLA